MNRKETLKQWLLKHKLKNYGYDRKWFNKMTSKKTQLKSQIKQMSDAEIRRSLAKAGILGRGGRLGQTPSYKKVMKNGKVAWVKTGSKEWDYTVGQSFNEELLNMLQISASKRKKSFWDVQNKWFHND